MSTLDLLVRRLTDSGFGSERLPYRARNANTALGIADNGGWFDLTGTFAQTFQAVGSIGPDASFVLRNAGTGDITLDPNGSETIDGLTSFVMYPGEARLIQCDGTALRSIVLHGFTKVFTASDNFIKPPGYRSFNGMMWSAGCSGSRGAEQGGAGGGAFPFEIEASRLGATELVVIGAGGAPSNSTTFNPGGDTTFAGLVVKGAAGPVTGGSIGVPLAGGSDQRWTRQDAFSNSQSNSGSVYGGASGGTNVSSSGTVYGGGGGGGYQGSNIFPPTPSKLGGAGGLGSFASNGGDGTAPGGGGGTTQTGTQGGAGARGQINIRGAV